jgi:hypothetical protein
MGQSKLAQAETASRWKALMGPSSQAGKQASRQAGKQASINPACIAIGLPDTPYWVSYEPIARRMMVRCRKERRPSAIEPMI